MPNHLCQAPDCNNPLPDIRNGRKYCCPRCAARGKWVLEDGRRRAELQRAEQRIIELRGRKATGKDRHCLKCGGTFWSEGAWNRLCGPCNAANSNLVAFGHRGDIVEIQATDTMDYQE